MANETYISPISFLKGNNLGHIFSELVFNYLTSEPKCKPQLQSTQYPELKTFHCADICIVKNINIYMM